MFSSPGGLSLRSLVHVSNSELSFAVLFITPFTTHLKLMIVSVGTAADESASPRIDQISHRVNQFCSQVQVPLSFS